MRHSDILYAQGMRSQLFNKRVYWKQILFGAWQASFCSFFAYYCCESSPVQSGHMLYFAATGMVSLFSSVVIGNIKVFLFSHTHSCLSLFFQFGSILFYVANHAIVSQISPEFEVYNTFRVTFSATNFWAAVLLTQGITMCIELAFARMEQQQSSQAFEKTRSSKQLALSTNQSPIQVIPKEQEKRRQISCGIELVQYNEIVEDEGKANDLRQPSTQPFDFKSFQSQQMEISLEDIKMQKAFSSKVQQELANCQKKDADHNRQMTEPSEIQFQSQFQTFQRQHTGYAFSGEDHREETEIDNIRAIDHNTYKQSNLHL